MRKSKFDRDNEKLLSVITQQAKLMHRKEFSYKSFNRKFRSILRFNKSDDNFFRVSIPDFEPVVIQIENQPHCKYAIVTVPRTGYTFSFPIKYGKDLIEKILYYDLLTLRRFPFYLNF